MHFSALKFQDFLGKHAPRRRPPQKRGTYVPLVDTVVYSLYFNQLAILFLCRFVIFAFQDISMYHKQTGSSQVKSRCLESRGYLQYSKGCIVYFVIQLLSEPDK